MKRFSHLLFRSKSSSNDSVLLAQAGESAAAAALAGLPSAAGLSEVAVLHAAETKLQERNLAGADLLLSPFATHTTNPVILVQLAKLRMVQGELDTALQLLRRAEQHHPADRKTWETLAELLMMQRRYQEELVYRRRSAYADAHPSIQTYTALLRALTQVVVAGDHAPKSEVQFASKKVAQTAGSDQADLRAEFAETLYPFKGFEAEAGTHYIAAAPCPATKQDVAAKWSNLREWCEESGSPLHRLSTGGLPGVRPMIAELKNVCVFPHFQWIPVLDGGKVALDGFQVSRMRLRRESPHTPILMSSATSLELRIPRQMPVIDRPALLIGSVPQYYHHTIDHISRLALVEALGVGASLPLVINDDVAPFQLEHLALLGYSAERLIRVKANTPICFRQLFVPTPLVNGGQWMDPMIPNWYRSRLVHCNGEQQVRKRRLYLSRRSAARRRLANEDELCRMLISLGFEIVHPEELNVKEQIGLFSTATHIVAPSGAALTNMIYSPAGAQVVSLYSRYADSGAGDRYFDALATACGHRFSVVLGEIRDLSGFERVLDAEFAVDVEAVRATLA